MSATLPAQLSRGEFLGQRDRHREIHDIALSVIRYEPNTTLRRHQHESAYLSFVLAGDYSERTAARTWRCGPNTLRSHPPGEEHSDQFGTTGGVCLNMELSSQWLAQMEILPRLESLATDECAAISLRLLRALHRADADEALTTEELVLALLDACDRVRAVSRACQVSPWLRRALDYVESHLDRRFALRDVAAAAGVHPTHLARTFRARTNTTLGHYVRRRRIARAQAALRWRRQRSLTALALELGFADHAHLSRTFKTVTGLTPKEFRDLA